MSKVFLVLSGFTLPSDGMPRIYLPTETGDTFTDEWIHRILSQWSQATFGQNGEHRLYKFPVDHRRFQDALSFLLAHGYDELSHEAFFQTEEEEVTQTDLAIPLSSRDILETLGIQ